MKTTTVTQPQTQTAQTNTLKEKYHAPDADKKKESTSGPVDVWCFKKRVYQTPEGDFPQGLAHVFHAAEKVSRPEFPQRYDEGKFSIYEQPLHEEKGTSRWEALVEFKNDIIASVVADGPNYKINLFNMEDKAGLISREELMEAIDGAKDELELGRP